MATVCRRCGAILDDTGASCLKCNAASLSARPRRQRILGSLLGVSAVSEAVFLAAIFTGHWGEDIPFARIVHQSLVRHGSSRPTTELLQTAVGRYSAGVDGAMAGWLPDVSSLLLLLLLVVGLGYVYIYRHGMRTGYVGPGIVVGLGAAGFVTFVDPVLRIYVMTVTFNPVITVCILGGLLYAFVEAYLLRADGN